MATAQKKRQSKIKRPGNRLTYSELLSKDGPLAQGGAVPAAIAELVLALVDAQLGAFADDNDGIRASLAKSPLTWGQSWDFIADDVSTQSYHRGQGPAKRRHICNSGHLQGQIWDLKLSAVVVKKVTFSPVPTHIKTNT